VSVEGRDVHVLLGRRYDTKEEVLRAIGDVMLASGAVLPRYVEGMLEKEARVSTWVTDDVALPHGTNEVKREVLRDCLVLVQLPDGVEWGAGRRVRLAFGFAGRGDDEHVRLLKRLATVLQSSEELARLRETSDEEEAMRILAAHAAERASGDGAGGRR
jgi:mannitol/fructose-specific phosphotransferase system IIA component